MHITFVGSHIPLMSAALRIQDYVGELPPIDFGGRLASAAEALAQIEQSVRRLRTNLDTLYSDIQNMAPGEISAGADGLLGLEREHAEALVPRIKIAEGWIDTAVRRGPPYTAAEKSFMRQAEGVANALAAWLESLRDMRIRLHLLASDKMREAGAPDVEVTDDEDLDRYFRSATGR